MKKPITTDLKIKAGPGEEYDYEGYMVRTQLRRMSSQAQELLMLTKDEEQFPAWMQSKITLASEYMDGFYDFYKYSDYSIVSTAEVDKEEESDDEEDTEEDSTEAEDMMDMAEEMLPPSVRMMKNATKEG
jgi:hypothetical protein